LRSLPDEQARLERVARAVVGTLPKALAHLYIESIFLTMLPTSSHHPAHADNERFEAGRWVPNHTPKRHFSSITYLNSDFVGGELCFENLGVRIQPSPGLLVAFPSHHGFYHKVEPVTRGRRYSVPVWFTNDKACQLLMRTIEECPSGRLH
jgi:hypothetical protein